MIKLSVCCCTYNRSDSLGEMIQSFLLQTYPKEYCELIILDDAGQYGDLRGDNWQIVSFPRRFASLGEKRNACVSLVSPDFTHVVVADDDDIYLPWWLDCHATNFEKGAEWSFASSIYWSENNQIVTKWHYHVENWIMHPAHAFSKELFWRVGGYPQLAWKEDHYFFEKLRERKIEHKDALDQNQQPYMICRRNLNNKHIHTTGMGLDIYQSFKNVSVDKFEINIDWNRNYLEDAHQFEQQKGSSPQCVGKKWFICNE